MSTDVTKLPPDSMDVRIYKVRSAVWDTHTTPRWAALQVRPFRHKSVRPIWSRGNMTDQLLALTAQTTAWDGSTLLFLPGHRQELREVFSWDIAYIRGLHAVSRPELGLPERSMDVLIMPPGPNGTLYMMEPYNYMTSRAFLFTCGCSVDFLSTALSGSFYPETSKVVLKSTTFGTVFPAATG